MAADPFRGEGVAVRLAKPSGPARILTSPLALTPGTRLGPYEVTAQIGVGGMGALARLSGLQQPPRADQLSTRDRATDLQ